MSKYRKKCEEIADALTAHSREYSSRKAARAQDYQKRIQTEIETIGKLDLSSEQLILDCATRAVDLHMLAETVADYMMMIDVIKKALDISAPMADELSDGQSVRASKPRGKVETDDGEMSISELIGFLANHRQHKDKTAKELWPEFWYKLDEKGLSPKDTDKKDGVIYNVRLNESTHSYKTKTMTLLTFANKVSKSRKKYKSR